MSLQMELKSDNKQIQYGQYVAPLASDCVNMGIGQPSYEHLPLNQVVTSMASHTRFSNPGLLQYGDIQGYLEFRQDLAKFLEKQYEKEVNPDNLMVTHGVTGAVSLLCSVFATKQKTLMIAENPTYFLMLDIFKDFNLDVATVPMEVDGLSINKLRKLVEEKSSEYEKIILYTIPVSHNPTGYTMTEQKKILLCELADEYNLMIWADETYQMLYFNEKPSPPLYYYNPNKVISLGTFSKILAPSLRVGWLQTSPKLMKPVKSCGQLDSSGGVNPITSSIVHQLLMNGEQEKYLEYIRNVLSKKCYTLCERLDKSDLVKYNKPTGGYFLWLDIGLNGKDFLDYCSKIKFHPGFKFTIGSSCDNYIRLSFSFYRVDEYLLGVERLLEQLEVYKEEYMRNKQFVSVCGHRGRLGNRIVNYLNKDKRFHFVGGIDRDMRSDNKSVIIDVSSPKGNELLINNLIITKNYRPLIIGTTGKLNHHLIKKYSKYAPVALLSNFSYGIPKLLDICKQMGDMKNFKVSITETHHVHKKDAPSGTAKSLANSLDFEVEIESIRKGEEYGTHQVVFESDMEKITFEHKAKDRDIFATGCLRFIPWIKKQKPGLYTEMKEKKLEYNIYSGCGNTFVIGEANLIEKDLDLYLEKVEEEGCDGLLSVSNNSGSVFWKYYNRDGSTVAFCGNGSRCVAAYAFEKYRLQQVFKLMNNFGIETDVKCCLGSVVISTPTPEIISENQVIVGVPHYYVKMNTLKELDNLDVNTEGARLYKEVEAKHGEHNINFYYKHFLRTYERGVFRETLACGSGATGLAALLGREKTDVCLRGGDVLRITNQDGIFYMAGKVEIIR